jgi:hypothetical protein
VQTTARPSTSMSVARRNGFEVKHGAGLGKGRRNVAGRHVLVQTAAGDIASGFRGDVVTIIRHGHDSRSRGRGMV